MVSSLWACQMRDDCAEAITTLTSVTALSREPLSVKSGSSTAFTLGG